MLKKRKLSFKQSMKALKKAEEESSGVVLNKNPQIAKLELEMLTIAERAKTEGIQ